MDLRQRLKTETAPLHDKIEQSFLLKKIIQQKMTREEYPLLIKQFYGFIKPCESLINSLPCKAILNNREKTAFLEQDLQVLGVPKNNLSSLPQCKRIPTLTEHEHVLGYLYVMEGATLGGQVIGGILKNQLQITPHHGGKFFNSYGNNTKNMWHIFCHHLRSITDPEQQNTIFASACLTYSTLSHWLENFTETPAWMTQKRL